MVKSLIIATLITLAAYTNVKMPIMPTYITPFELTTFKLHCRQAQLTLKSMKYLTINK